VAIELFLASVRLYAVGASSWPPSALCRRGIILASVGFMPSGHHLGLRRLYAVGAKVCSYKGPCCESVFFFRRKAAEEKKRLGRTEYRFAEYEYDEIRCEARTKRSPRTRNCVTSIRDAVCPRPPVGLPNRRPRFAS